MQFGSAPWLREHIRGQVDRYLGTVSLESNDLGRQIRRAIDEARAGADVRGMGGLFLLLNDEQRDIVRHVQAMMSLLEGHASYVMNEVAKEHVPDLPRLKRALTARRSPCRVPRESDPSSERSASTRRSGSTTPGSCSSVR